MYHKSYGVFSSCRVVKKKEKKGKRSVTKFTYARNIRGCYLHIVRCEENGADRSTSIIGYDREKKRRGIFRLKKRKQKIECAHEKTERIRGVLFT